jgi:hypothetical protein
MRRGEWLEGEIGIHHILVKHPIFHSRTGNEGDQPNNHIPLSFMKGIRKGRIIHPTLIHKRNNPEVILTILIEIWGGNNSITKISHRLGEGRDGNTTQRRRIPFLTSN